jgi:hypothetical protein
MSAFEEFAGNVAVDPMPWAFATSTTLLQLGHLVSTSRRRSFGHTALLATVGSVARAIVNHSGITAYDLSRKDLPAYGRASALKALDTTPPGAEELLPQYAARLFLGIPSYRTRAWAVCELQ